MEEQCWAALFCGEMLSPYEKKDVLYILKYYAQYDAVPPFYTFDEIDRSKLDVKAIAQKIWNEDMGARRRAEYVESIWDEGDDNLLQIFFGRKLYFLRQVDIEYMKIAYPDIYDTEPGGIVRYDPRKLEDLPLVEIGKIDPELEKRLRDGVFEKAKTENGEYRCALCGAIDSSRLFFQVDHIVPMNQGGKSVPENLQILCRHCNGLKGDR